MKMAEDTKPKSKAILIITIIFVILILSWVGAVIYMKIKSKWIFKTYTPPQLSNGYYPGGGLMTDEQFAAYKKTLTTALASASA